MKRKKSFFVLFCILTSVLCFLSFSGCGGGSKDTPVTTTPTTTTTTTSSTVTISGTVTFSSYSSGSINVGAFSSASYSASPDITGQKLTGSTSVSYTLTVPANKGNVYIAAYNDVDGDDVNDSTEAQAAYSANPVSVGTSNISGINITLSSSSSCTLTSITISSSKTSLSIGETLQFSATGTYSDGSTQTITNSISWASSNTSVATITAPTGTSGGLLTGVSAGTTEITAYNSSCGVTSNKITITVLANTLTLVGSYDTPGTAQVVYVDGNYAYIGDGNNLFVVDVSNPASPSLAGSVNIPSASYNFDVVKIGNYVYLSTDGFLDVGHVIDVTSPSSPSYVGKITYTGNCSGQPCTTNEYVSAFAISSNYLFIAPTLEGGVYDISNPASPTKISGSAVGSSGSGGLKVQGSYLYALSNASGYSNKLTVLDILDPTNPITKGSYSFSYTPSGFCISGNYGYISKVSGSVSGSALDVIDISNPASLTSSSSLSLTSGGGLIGGPVKTVAFSSNKVYIAAYSYLYAVDVSTPTSPTLKQTIDLSSSSSWKAYSVFVSGNYLYVAGGSGGLKIYQIQ